MLRYQLVSLLWLLSKLNFVYAQVWTSPVVKHEIPGVIASPEVNDSVVLHVFTRVASMAPGKYEVRGFAFATSVPDTFTSWGGGIFSMPPSSVDWQVQLRLKETFRQRVFSMDVFDTSPYRERSPQNDPRMVMPFRFVGVVETDEAVLELHVNSWDRFSHLLLAPSTPLEPRTQRYTVVLPPVSGLPAATAAYLAATNAAYHVKLGLDVIVYASLPYLAAYTNNQCISKMQAQGRLSLILWDQIAASQSHSYGHKPLCYSHALLSKWGSEDSILMLDVDEFVILPSRSKGNIANYLTNCTQGASMATVSRCNTVLRSNDTRPDIALWDMADGCNIEMLERYGHVSLCHPPRAGKSIVSSSNVLGFAVHHGHVMTGYAVDVDKECMRVLHIVNLMKRRSEYSNRMHHWQEWKWVFDKS